MEDQCHVIIIYVALIVLGLRNYSMNIQDLTNLCNKRIRHDHHAENYRRSMIEDETSYGLRIKRKPGIQTASVNFIEKWNEILKGTERKLVELLLTESVIVSKTIEDKFEEKLKETFPNNFRSIRNQIKQQSKEVITTLDNRQRKKWLNIKNKNRFVFKRTLVRESREHSSSDRFKNVTRERDRSRKLKEKYLKLSIYDTRSFPPETSMCKLIPSGH